MIVSKLLGFFESKVVLYADKDNQEAFVSLISGMDISAKLTQNPENEGIFARMSASNAKKVACALDKTDIIVYINNICGIGNVLAANRRRVGLFIGFLLFAILLTVSTFFIFKVEISGNGEVSAHKIKAELAELGVREGVLLDGVNRQDVTNRFLILHPEFSWMAINVKGTTVCVELRSRSSASNEDVAKHDFLVADTDAVIRYLEIKSGKALVDPGISVKKGDLLISGYISGNGLQYSDEPALRYDGALGRVYAQTDGAVEVFVPYKETVSCIRQPEKVGVSVSFFGFTFSFGTAETGAGYSSSPARHLTLWGGVELPLTVSEYYHTDSTKSEIKRSEEQALADAQEMANQKLILALEKASLLGMRSSSTVEKDGIRIKIEYSCIRNIAVPMDIKT